ncbi:MAG TPA: response regulator [Pyrinomonadaceae bacterium]|jgi:DNA-binding response OmpR family regulator
MRHSSSPRILYIENNQDGDGLVAMLRRAENRPYCVLTANTPGDALELIADEPFDLLILEHQLPEMSGVELCRRIRQTDKRTPILFCTGRTRLAECEVSLAAGATEYLIRPIGTEHLIETVRRLLHEFHAPKPNSQAACCLAK